MTAAAFTMRILISASSDRLLSIVEPRYVNLSTASIVTLSMLIDGGETMPWPIYFVFLMLIVSSNSLQDHLTNLSMSSCNLCVSPISLVFLNSLVSSANFNILPVIPSYKSLLYSINQIGPSTDP